MMITTYAFYLLKINELTMVVKKVNLGDFSFFVLNKIKDVLIIFLFLYKVGTIKEIDARNVKSLITYLDKVHRLAEFVLITMDL